jgi:hypothetical protein
LCSEQGSNSSILSSISSNIPFLFLIGSVIGLLQLNDLFETHPANMWISEAALLMFCLSHATWKKINGTHWATYSQIIDSFRLLSGTLVLVSLSSIPLPHQLWWLFFAVWVLLAFIVLSLCIYPGVEGRNVDRGQTSFLISQNFSLFQMSQLATLNTHQERRHSATQPGTRISFDSNGPEGRTHMPLQLHRERGGQNERRIMIQCHLNT